MDGWIYSEESHTVTIEREFDEGFEALNEHYIYTVKIDRQPKLSIGSPTSGVAAEFTNTYQPTYTVSFDMQGHGAPVDLQHVKAGDKAEKPVDPTETGYTLPNFITTRYHLQMVSMNEQKMIFLS